MAKRKSTKKKSIPNFQRKQPRPQVIPALLAQSHKTNIAHIFENPKIWEEQILNLANAHQTRMVQDLLKAIPFWNWLQQQPAPNNSFLTPWNKSIVRIVYGGLDPLSVSGSLAAGGRYNVGGAQQIHIDGLSDIQMQAALYASDTEACAKAEAGQFLGQAEIYELHANREILLWDVDKVISSYAWPGLQSLVDGEPFNKLWKLQKTPAISQILGMFLRSFGGDGILSKSVQYPTGFVVTIFLKDDNTSKQLFTVSRI